MRARVAADKSVRKVVGGRDKSCVAEGLKLTVTVHGKVVVSEAARLGIGVRAVNHVDVVQVKRRVRHLRVSRRRSVTSGQGGGLSAAASPAAATATRRRRPAKRALLHTRTRV